MAMVQPYSISKSIYITLPTILYKTDIPDKMTSTSTNKTFLDLNPTNNYLSPTNYIIDPSPTNYIEYLILKY